MNKKYILLLGVVLVVLLGLIAIKVQAPENVKKTSETTVASSPLNATYLIDGTPITLINGKAESEIAPGSAEKNVVSIFGEPSYGDINGDGGKDAVVILVNTKGGSGAFYYAAIAVDVGGTYKGTDTILLGDRIAPQTTLVEGRNAIVNYVVRLPGEPFTTRPSVGKSLYLQFDPTTLRLIEVMQNFEGEADPARMTLEMQTWKWFQTSYRDGAVITPKKFGDFTITFKKDGTFSATTDCNSIGGAYEAKNGKITFKNMFSTLMACEGSQEQDFQKMLNNILSYSFTNRGELVFRLSLDSESFIFK